LRRRVLLANWRGRSRSIALIGLGGLLAGTYAVACTNDRIVYRSGANFAAPPVSAAGFIGYYDNANRQTVCGSCHIDYQTRWSATKHGAAWTDLSPGMGSFAGSLDNMIAVEDVARGNSLVVASNYGLLRTAEKLMSF